MLIDIDGINAMKRVEFDDDNSSLVSLGLCLHGPEFEVGYGAAAVRRRVLAIIQLVATRTAVDRASSRSAHTLNCASLVPLYESSFDRHDTRNIAFLSRLSARQFALSAHFLSGYSRASDRSAGVSCAANCAHR